MNAHGVLEVHLDVLQRPPVQVESTSRARSSSCETVFASTWLV